ncbi:hypothetical protein P9443_06400 [Peribacillus frigoritolerans]|uniref:hypothetical protein n=1 Tax=Peribacillus frigoritolerans TaxID=450367 RepID=UPI002E23B3E4|nr:hypothetical protein [Peribacillus frigoritolerans]
MILSCNLHWKRFATLLPNYWLAETPQAERDFKAKLIGTEGARLLRENRVQGRPHRRKDAEGGPPAESECLKWKSTSIKERERISSIN